VLKACLVEVRQTFKDKFIHVFGIGRTAKLHLAALLGMDSVDTYDMTLIVDVGGYAIAATKHAKAGDCRLDGERTSRYRLPQHKQTDHQGHF
jgi:hypothetical protein